MCYPKKTTLKIISESFFLVLSNRLLNPFFFDSFECGSSKAFTNVIYHNKQKKATNKITHLEKASVQYEGKFLVQKGKKLNYDQWDEHTKKCPFNATSKRIYSINFETKWKNKLIQPHLLPFSLYRPVSTFFSKFSLLYEKPIHPSISFVDGLKGWCQHYIYNVCTQNDKTISIGCWFHGKLNGTSADKYSSNEHKRNSLLKFISTTVNVD